jgi:uncharacterized protein (TIGR00251 family)
MTDWYYWQGDDLVLQLRVQPRASRDEWIGPCGAHLRLRITAPPSEGKANRHLCRFLAQVFQVPPARVTLLAGDASRCKRVLIHAPRRLPLAIAVPSAAAVARDKATQ